MLETNSSAALASTTGLTNAPPTLKRRPANAPAFKDLAIQLNKSMQEKLERAGIYNVFRVQLAKKEGEPHPLHAAFLNAFDKYDADVTPEPGYNTHRQTQNCNCCLDTIARVGDTVIIDPVTGKTISLIWDETDVDPYWHDAVLALRLLVEKQPILGVFVYQNDDRLKNGTTDTAGVEEKGQAWDVPFNHFAFDMRAVNRLNSAGQSADAALGSSIHDFESIKHHLSQISLETATTANGYFQNDEELKGCEAKFSANVNWFYLVKKRDAETLNRRIAENWLWMESAMPYEGRVNFLNTCGGQFTYRLEKGTSFNEAKREFLKIAHPHNYMVATEKPSEGNIAAAEKIIEELGLKLSLERRFARMDEIPVWLWKPAPVEVKEEEKPAGVFASVKSKQAAEEEKKEAPIFEGGTKSWQWFEANVLPKAVKLEIKLNHRLFCFLATTTAKHMDAPPIMRHDLPEKRNPMSNMLVSQMKHHLGCLPEVYDLPENKFVEITGITYSASNLTDEEAWPKSPRMMVLKGAKVQNVSGRGLFPAELIPALYPVRATIDAYSRSSEVLEGGEESFISLWTGNHLEYNLYATDKDGNRTHYYIDRNEVAM